VIVKRLPAVHNLGAMQVLCTDKTGTLTEDRMDLACHLDPLGRADPSVLRWACVNSYLATLGAAAVADAADEALLRYTAVLDAPVQAGLAGIGAVPFDFARRRVTVVVRREDRPGVDTLVMKGAVEEVLDGCARVHVRGADVPLDAAQHAHLTRLADAYARHGIRLLAVALADRPARRGGYRPADETGTTLIGFVGFRDQPREGACLALAALAERGVEVKVLTGDHPLVAARVCRDAGIDAGQVILGRDIDPLSDAALAALAAKTTVFARVGPGQKARIVRALRASGRTVGFLGDGVNDTAALRVADVGISVEHAVDAARESADVILPCKDLAALGRAVGQGRRTFANIVKYIKITVSSNVGNAASMLAAGFLLPFLPMLPLQILAQNVCFDLSQLSLAFDRVDDESLLRRPRTFESAGIARFVFCFGLINSLADLATFAILWRITGAHAGPVSQALFRTGWFVENLLTQALAVHLLRSRALPSPRNHAARPVLAASAAIIVAAVCLPFSPLAAPLGMHGLRLTYFPLLALVLCGYCTATLGVKAVCLKIGTRWL
jgi:P-type Mg2+ transporter